MSTLPHTPTFFTSDCSASSELDLVLSDCVRLMLTSCSEAAACVAADRRRSSDMRISVSSARRWLRSAISRWEARAPSSNRAVEVRARSCSCSCGDSRRVSKVLPPSPPSPPFSTHQLHFDFLDASLAAGLHGAALVIGCSACRGCLLLCPLQLPLQVVLVISQALDLLQLLAPVGVVGELASTLPWQARSLTRVSSDVVRSKAAPSSAAWWVASEAAERACGCTRPVST